MAAHLCPPTAIGWKARSSHPSKPCRATSGLVGRAYSAAGQAASALHSVAVIQVFQSKMFASEEAGLDTASLRDLRSASDLALCTTKTTAQAIGHSVSSLIVECHLRLTMMEMKEADKVPSLDAPVSSGSLFGPAVESFAERFTEAQKSSQAMQHFLPKRTALLLLPVTLNLRRLSSQLSQRQLILSPDLIKLGRIEGVHARQDATPSRSAKNPGPRSPWIQRWISLPPDHPASSLVTSLSTGCRGKCVIGSPRAHFSTRASNRCDSGQNKTHTFSKREQISSSAYHKRPALPFQLLTTRAEAWQAIPGVSEWVMATIRRGYTLQFARRPLRFRGVLATTVLRAEVMNLLEKEAIEIGADMLLRNNVSSEEWTLHPLSVQKIWEVFGRARVDLFASEDNSHCPIFFTKSTDEFSALCFPSNRSATTDTQASQGATAQACSNSPPLELVPAARSSPVANALKTRPLSSERHAMASTFRVMGPACVAAQREPFDLPERVLNTVYCVQ